MNEVNKEKRSALNNVAYLLKNAWQLDKILFLQMIIYSVLSAIVPFIGIFLPKLLLDELMGQKRFNVFVIILVVTLAVAIVVNFGLAYLKNIFGSRVIGVRFKYIQKIEEKSMTMDFKNTEDPKILNDIKNASIAVQNNSNGIEGVYRKLFGIVGSIVAFVGYILIVYTLSPWILLYLILNVAIIYTLDLKVKKYEYSRKFNNVSLF